MLTSHWWAIEEDEKEYPHNKRVEVGEPYGTPVKFQGKRWQQDSSQQEVSQRSCWGGPPPASIWIWNRSSKNIETWVWAWPFTWDYSETEGRNSTAEKSATVSLDATFGKDSEQSKTWSRQDVRPSHSSSLGPMGTWHQSQWQQHHVAGEAENHRSLLIASEPKERANQ